MAFDETLEYLVDRITDVSTEVYVKIDDGKGASEILPECDELAVLCLHYLQHVGYPVDHLIKRGPKAVSK